MSKEYFNYSETFCDAVDIIVSEKLKQLEYDITKVCTIIDDTYKKLGKYTVREDSIKFEAYSINTTYNIGDAVLVTIPNGDYSMQKTIVSKAVIEEDLTTSVAYTSPLSNFLDFTGNIVPQEIKASLLANNPDEHMIKLCSIPWNNSGHSLYDKMGISVDFQTWLSELNVASGTYGLLFYFYQNNPTLITDIEEKKGISYVFNVNDFLGNPYMFENYFTQEKVIDISQLSNIYQLDVWFYQNNDFKDFDGKMIPYLIEENNDFFSNAETYDQKLNNNIFINNLKISLGYDSGAFTGDELRISTEDMLSYSRIKSNNDKTIHLKWIHKIDENKYISLNDKTEGIELYWVRSDNQSQITISNIVGDYWVEQNFNFPSGKFNDITFNIDTNLVKKREIRVKVVGRIKGTDGNWTQYTSNILSFLSEDPYVDETTYDAATGLVIKCSDGSEGNYLIYNQSGEIINEGQGQGYNRKFELWYKNARLENSELKNNIDEVIWSLPYNTNTNNSYTMLNYKLSDLNNKEPTDNMVFVTRSSKQTENYNQNYSILNTWYISNSHNTVSCEIITKQGTTYKAQKELIFGKANSQGSNLSIVLQYENNKNAFEIATDDNNNIIKSDPLKIKGLAYDLSGKLVSTSSGTWSWKMFKGTNFSIANTTSNISTLTFNRVDNLENIGYNILEVSYKDASTEREIKTYFPIAIKTLAYNSNTKNYEERCFAMEGARKIIYNAQGNPTYYNDIYKLLLNNENDQTINWTLKKVSESEYDPVLKTIKRNNIDYKALQANQVFISDHDYQISVVASIGKLIYWIQPILIMQSEYDFAIVNDWTGVTETNDESIVSSVIAAGKKSEDNKFSGIILGDVLESATNAISQTGLYGINKGAITFSLTDSGLATFEHIGTNINSRVLLGTENHLMSHTDSNGLKNLLDFDLDNQELTFEADVNSSGRLKLSAKSPYLSFTTNSNKNLFSIGDNTCLLQSSDEILKINLIDKTINGGSSATLNWNGPMSCSYNNIYIGTTSDSNGYIFKAGDLIIDNSGTVYYKGTVLSTYIEEQIKNAT